MLACRAGRTAERRARCAAEQRDRAFICCVWPLGAMTHVRCLAALARRVSGPAAVAADAPCRRPARVCGARRMWVLRSTGEGGVLVRSLAHCALNGARASPAPSLARACSSGGRVRHPVAAMRPPSARRRGCTSSTLRPPSSRCAVSALKGWWRGKSAAAAASEALGRVLTLPGHPSLSSPPRRGAPTKGHAPLAPAAPPATGQAPADAG